MKKVLRRSEVVFYGIILLSRYYLASSCSDEGTSSPIKINITCDRVLSLFVDGKFLGGVVMNSNNKAFVALEIMAGSHVIALTCSGSTPPWQGGILGSFDNGVVTDQFWKCSTFATPGWSTRTYPDHDWPMAVSYGRNSDSVFPWGEISSIDKKAAWIWTKDNRNDTKIHCRRNLVEPCACTRVKPSLFQTLQSGRDIAIEDFLLLQTKVASPTECGLRCGQRSACASFTVESSESPGSKPCELYSVTAKSHPHSVVRKEGFQYYEAVLQIF